MNNAPISNKQWHEKFSPLLYEEGNEEYMEFNDAVEKASKFNASNPQFHVWTRIDSDSGEELILVNGFRICNKIDYCVTEKAWGFDVNGSYYQEVHDELYED